MGILIGMNNTGWVYAGSGGASSFGSSLTASGGGGAGSKGYYDEGYTYSYTPGSRWYAKRECRTNAGKVLEFGRMVEHGFALSFAKNSGDFGSGGKCFYLDSASGGSGGYNTSYVSVTPGSIIQITVGAGGKNKHGDLSPELTDGKTGFVLIAYGGDI